MMQPVSISDKSLFDRYLLQNSQRTVEFGFACLYAWAHKSQLGYSVWQDWLLTCNRQNGAFWLMPYGPADCRDAVVHCMKLHDESFSLPFCLSGVTDSGKDYLESVFPRQFQFTEMPDRFDYLYRTSDLCELTGKRYHSKRNHINRFKQQYGDRAETEAIHAGNLPEIRAFENEWRRDKSKNGSGETPASYISLQDEEEALRRLLPNLDPLGAKGRLLRLDGHVVAFTVGAPIGTDTMDILCEKAILHIGGAYQFINQLFAQNECTGYTYINREEDMGLPGLRKAKLSYYPVELLRKYTARRCTP
jgi:hypothetical protein